MYSLSGDKSKRIAMNNLKLTVKIFLISIPIFTFLGYLDYETTSLAQILFTKEGLLFLLFYGILFTILGWIIIGMLRLKKLKLTN